MNLDFMTDGEIAELLGNRLRTYRMTFDEYGITRERVAQRAGVSLSSVERFEKGGNPRLLTVISILREFGLLGGLVAVIPDTSGLTPMQIIEQMKPGRKRAYVRKIPRSITPPLPDKKID